MDNTGTHAKRYGFYISWDPLGEHYVAICPDFPSITGFGQTLQEALRYGEAALKLTLIAYAEEGAPLPQPTLSYDARRQVT